MFSGLLCFEFLWNLELSSPLFSYDIISHFLIMIFTVIGIAKHYDIFVYPAPAL